MMLQVDYQLELRMVCFNNLNLIQLRLFVVDKKIAALDDELRKYKDQLKKTTGSANAAIKKRAMDCLKRKVFVSIVKSL